MQTKIETDRATHYPDSKAGIIYLGDYIDRGPSSRRVIDAVRNGLGEFDRIWLKGNHEAMMLDCLDPDRDDSWYGWLVNGGDATLQSFGYPLALRGYDSDVLAECLGDERVDWLSKLRLTYRVADYLFVHAGIRPGRRLEKQVERDLIWIREPFLSSRKDFGFVVVHGHTPVEEPEVKSNRICVDTGAVWGNRLTALVVDRTADELVRNPRFLSVEADEAYS
jgi:serine/threonine protein phosphatase 1